MSTQSNTTNQDHVIPIGIDIGSLNARIAVSSSSSSSYSSSAVPTNNPTDLPHHQQHPATRRRGRYQTSQPGNIIPNESGERFTPSVSTMEPQTIADPENDQYWDVPNNNNNSSSNNKKKNKEETMSVPQTYIFGEAAIRSLQQEKKDVKERSIRSLLACIASSSSSDDDNNDDDHHHPLITPEEQDEKRNAAQAFVSHLLTQATDATHSHPSSLRLVLSTPDAEYDSSTPSPSSSSSPSPSLSPQITPELIRITQSALRTSIRSIGWETAPEFTQSTTMPSTKREKKAFVQRLESMSRVCGVITESMAICHAHDLFRFEEYGPSWSSSSSSLSSSLSSLSPPPPRDYTNVLILDWGHSSLKLTHLQRLSSTTQTLTPIRTVSHPEYGGWNLRLLLAKHIVELFVRQPMVRRCGITSVDIVWENRKARQKLERVCDGVLRTLSQEGGKAGVAKVAIDGLYDGMDCSVEVTSARFDMALGRWFRSAEALIRTFVTEEGMMMDSTTTKEHNNGKHCGLDVALVAGQVASFPPVKGIMDRLCGAVGSGGGGNGVWRGRGTAEVPPEETVAMGCAMYAAMVTSPFGRELVSEEEEDETKTKKGEEEEKKEQEKKAEVNDDHNTSSSAVEVDVPLCPIAVGLSMQEGDSASMVLIEAGTPLPASIARVVDVKDCVSSSGSLGIVQIGRLVGNGDDGNHGNEKKGVEERLVGRIQGIPDTMDKIEVCMELSVQGMISLSVNGGPIISL